MAREQKTKSKGSQTQSAKSKQRVAATQVRQATQSTTDATTDDTQVTNNIMAQNALDETISAQQEQGGASQPSTVEQSTTGDKQVVWTGLQPSWPSWPTSKPGSRSTPPMPGTRPINRFRPEQFKEVGYNQQTGEPAIQSPLRSFPDEHTTGPTSFDQSAAQHNPGKGKQRL
jgi:hypothetical protein